MWELENTIRFIYVALIAYLVGSLSPSIMLAKAKGIDIKKEGSGNAGTTNALRVLGKKYAIITLLLDLSKGVIPLLIAIYRAELPIEMVYMIPWFSLIGHIYPVFYRFKGGKGVATAFGSMLTINWVIGLIAFAIAAICLLITRMMAIGSICAAISVIFLAFFLEREFMIYSIPIVLLIIYKHKDNIIRIYKREEPKLSFKK